VQLLTLPLELNILIQVLKKLCSYMYNRLTYPELNNIPLLLVMFLEIEVTFGIDVNGIMVCS
jgi:hypothetical protein